MNQSFAILILSCDKYSHLWPAFFQCFRKHYPDCTWPVYLGSNQISCQEPGVKSILSGQDLDWSTSYLKILEQIKEEKIFVLLEDNLLASKFDTTLLTDVVQFAFAEKAKLIKFIRAVPSDRPHQNNLFGIYDKGGPYRATVMGIWDKNYLKSMLLPGENPWNFEILGSYRTAYDDGFYRLNRDFCQFAHMIEKGHWFPQAVEWAKRENLNIGEEKRPTLTGRHKAISLLQDIYFHTMLKVPWRLRLRFMNFLRKLLISY